MSLQDQVDKIAKEAISASLKYGLRLPPEGEIERLKHECIAQISSLLQAELGDADLASVAATAIYRSNYFEQRAAAYETRTGRLLDALDVTELGSTGTARVARDALAQLKSSGHPLISTAVSQGIAMERKIRASTASMKSKEKIDKVKAFATGLYESGKPKWKNPRQAGIALWEPVRDEAKRLGWPMSEEEGPVTLYKWLRDHV